MKVTPINRKFGKHAPGDVFDLPSKAAKIFIKAKKLKAVEEGEAVPPPQTYATRALQAAPPPAPAPYGYKADGTPRLRPAPTPRKKAAE